MFCKSQGLQESLIACKWGGDLFHCDKDLLVALGFWPLARFISDPRSSALISGKVLLLLFRSPDQSDHGDQPISLPDLRSSAQSAANRGFSDPLRPPFLRVSKVLPFNLSIRLIRVYPW
jgi:hypothetical protein